MVFWLYRLRKADHGQHVPRGEWRSQNVCQLPVGEWQYHVWYV
ncbi:Uncharacterised protein [Vibrio cholerae]|nr:Uncharacterised protein [Vibrio cholerae]